MFQLLKLMYYQNLVIRLIKSIVRLKNLSDEIKNLKIR